MRYTLISYENGTSEVAKNGRVGDELIHAALEARRQRTKVKLMTFIEVEHGRYTEINLNKRQMEAFTQRRWYGL